MPIKLVNINWKCKRTGTVFCGELLFPPEEAQRRVNYFNEHYKRAEHWVSPAGTFGAVSKALIPNTLKQLFEQWEEEGLLIIVPGIEKEAGNGLR